MWYVKLQYFLSGTERPLTKPATAQFACGDGTVIAFLKIDKDAVLNLVPGSSMKMESEFMTVFSMVSA